MKQFLLSVLLSTITANNCWTDDGPNIIFAIADDWGWPHASIYRNDEVCQTPTFDRIARSGLLFNHAYVAFPSCTASRNAILTGQYPWRLGSGANLWSTLDVKHKTYPQMPVITLATGENLGAPATWTTGIVTQPESNTRARKNS